MGRAFQLSEKNALLISFETAIDMVVTGNKHDCAFVSEDKSNKMGKTHQDLMIDVEYLQHFHICLRFLRSTGSLDHSGQAWRVQVSKLASGVAGTPS